jgi:hypothetical protein
MGFNSSHAQKALSEKDMISDGLLEIPMIQLVRGWTPTLQLHSYLQMRLLRGGLMRASPQGPCDDMNGLDVLDRHADGDAPDLLQWSSGSWGAAEFVRWRMEASMAKARITSDT